MEGGGEGEDGLGRGEEVEEGKGDSVLGEREKNKSE